MSSRRKQVKPKAFGVEGEGELQQNGNEPLKDNDAANHQVVNNLKADSSSSPNRTLPESTTITTTSLKDDAKEGGDDEVVVSGGSGDSGCNKSPLIENLSPSPVPDTMSNNLNDNLLTDNNIIIKHDSNSQQPTDQLLSPVNPDLIGEEGSYSNASGSGGASDAASDEYSEMNRRKRKRLGGGGESDDIESGVEYS